MSILGILLRFATGGVSGIVNYGLTALNNAVAKIDPNKKATIQAVINIASRVVASLSAFRWACPTRWQTAYTAVIDAVSGVLDACADLVITEEEAVRLGAKIELAYKAWNSDDDETCKE